MIDLLTMVLDSNRTLKLMMMQLSLDAIMWSLWVLLVANFRFMRFKYVKTALYCYGFL